LDIEVIKHAGVVKLLGGSRELDVFDDDRFGGQLLRLREQKIRLGNVAHGLLVKSLLGEPAGLNSSCS
jgi:hypothetical protein